MPKLSFPFIVATVRNGDGSVHISSAPGYVAAFTSTEKATEYMHAANESNWQMRLVSRPDLLPLVEVLKLRGVKGFCIDPVVGCGPPHLDFDRIDPSSF